MSPAVATVHRIRTLLVNNYQLDAERLTPEVRLDELGVDSLGVAELMFDIEDEFGLTMPLKPVPLVTLADVTGYIDRLIALQGAGARAAPARVS